MRFVLFHVELLLSLGCTVHWAEDSQVGTPILVCPASVWAWRCPAVQQLADGCGPWTVPPSLQYVSTMQWKLGGDRLYQCWEGRPQPYERPQMKCEGRWKTTSPLRDQQTEPARILLYLMPTPPPPKPWLGVNVVQLRLRHILLWMDEAIVK